MFWVETKSSKGSSVSTSRMPLLISLLIFFSLFLRWLVKPSSLFLYAHKTDLLSLMSTLSRMW